MDLAEHSAYPWLVLAEHHKEILHHEAHGAQLVDDFHMGQPLLIGANLVLALHNINPLGLQHPVRFRRPFKIKVEDGFVIFLCAIFRTIVVIIVLEILVVLMRGAAGRMHVGRIEHYAIKGRIAIGQLAAIHSVAQVSCSNVVRARWNILPEHPLAVSDIGHKAALRHKELQHVGEYLVVGGLAGREDKLVCRDAPGHAPCLLWLNLNGSV